MSNVWNNLRLDTSHAGQVADLRRWFLLLSALGIWLVLCATLYVWLQVQRMNLGYRLAELQTQQEQLMAVQRKLHLELQRAQEPFQLEKQGREKFGLAPPHNQQRLVIPQGN
jgi:cell division protein FtsL